MLDENQTSETLTLTEAQQMLGVSRTTLWRLIREYNLQTLTDLLDNRSKLVRRTDIERIQEDALKIRRGLAA